MITITFEADGLIKKLELAGKRASNLKPLLKEVGEYLVKKSQKRFSEGGIPRWKENVFGTPTLLKSGKLRDSVKVLETTENSVTVGTESPQRFHNAGYSYKPTAGQRRYFFWKLSQNGKFQKGKNIGNGMFNNPERRFLKFDTDDYPFIANKLQQYIVKD